MSIFMSLCLHRKTPIRFLLYSVIFAVNLAAAQTLPTVSAFEQQLIDCQKNFLKATQDQDTSSVSRSVADDFQGIGTNGDLYSKSEIVESAGEELPEDTRAYDFKVIKLTDLSAVVAYNLIVPGEKPRYRHMADTWAKIHGRWQLKFRQITANLWSANDPD